MLTDHIGAVTPQALAVSRELQARVERFAPMAAVLTEIREARLPLRHNPQQVLKIRERYQSSDHPLSLAAVVTCFVIGQTDLLVTVTSEPPFRFELLAYTPTQGPQRSTAVRFQRFEDALEAVLGWIARYVDPAWSPS